jgi:hypothetical protein
MISRNIIIYFHVSQWLKTGFVLVIEFIDHLQVVTTNNSYTIAVYTIYNHYTLIFSDYFH